MKSLSIAVLFCIIWPHIIAGLTIQDFARGNNLFTAAIYKEIIKKGDKNVLVSPLSAELALALAESGAKDETAEEIRTSLHLPNSDQDTRTVVKDLLEILKGEGELSLHTANKIYVREKFPIKNDYKKIATEVYKAEIENIDFSRNQEAADTINKWVEEQTEHKIKNLVNPSTLSAATPAVIVNALYFKGNWTSNDFHKLPVTKRTFHKTAKDVVEVDTMTNGAGRYKYYEDTQLKAKFLELPFKGEDAQMVLVLPNAIEGLAELETQAEEIFKQHSLQREIVDVRLPLFKVENQIDFKEVLKKLGVRKAFSGEADFSEIAGNKGDLIIEGVMQKTFINVNRDGVEAAAATNIWFYMSAPPRPTKTFHADHPFIFFIKVKDVILFAGKVSDPKY